MTKDVGRALLAAVAQHHHREGVAAELGSDDLTIRIGDATLVLAARLYARKGGNNGVVIEVEFRLRLWPPEWGEVIQYNTGWAERDAEALAQTVHGWVDGVWPVIATLYAMQIPRDLPQPMRLTIVTGTNAPVEWRVLAGPPIGKCRTDMLAAVEAELARTPPFTLMTGALADAVNQRRLRPDGIPCWGHLFASRLNGQPGSHEAMLRGEPWPEAVECLLNFKWPQSDALMTFRQFYVIQAATS